MNNNYLKLIIGPMYSGKSSSLLTEINRYKYITSNIIVVNSILDKQRHYDMEIDINSVGFLKTHDSKTFPAIMLNNLDELNINKDFKYADSSVIIIDEAQFYGDLYEFLKVELSKPGNKKFIVAGLSSDVNQEPIGDIIKLIPLADDIQKLSAICMYCKDGTLANFTRLNTRNIDNTKDSNIRVGDNELYAPCCRKHFL